MFGICEGTKRIETPYGDLIDEDNEKGENEYEIAQMLNSLFADKVNDSGENDYFEARNLFANPLEYAHIKEKLGNKFADKTDNEKLVDFHKQQLEMKADGEDRKIEQLTNEQRIERAQKKLDDRYKNEQITEIINGQRFVATKVLPIIKSEASISEQEPEESESDYGLRPDLPWKEREELLAAMRQEKAELKKQKEIDEFSESFYGPVYSDKGDVQYDEAGNIKPETVKKSDHPGYHYVNESHIGSERNQVIGKLKFVDDYFSNKIRHFILTNKEPNRSRVPLHIAALNGNKHFCTMIVKEATMMEVNILDEIIDLPDRDGLTPLYLLCEKGFLKEEDTGNEDQDVEDETKEGIGKKTDLDQKPIQPGEDDRGMLTEFEKEAKEKKEKKQKYSCGLEYLDYDQQTQMPLNNDSECSKPSRNYLVKLLIEYGANPNLQSQKVYHTPLHWLAYWGDWRAVRVLLQMNTQDKVQIQPGWFNSTYASRDKIYEKHGAFNSFTTHDGQTPADIAGDLGNFKCVKEMIVHFIKLQQQLDIIKAFVTTEHLKRYGQDRFEDQITNRINQQNKDGSLWKDMKKQLIEVTFASSRNMNQVQQSYLNIAYWAMFMSTFEKQSEEERKKEEMLVKNFIYIFIMDLGISPFVKCYDRKTMISATVSSGRLDLLEELLSHTYETVYLDDFMDVQKRCQSKDIKGNNLMHDIMLLPETLRIKYLRVINETHVNLHFNPEKRNQKIPKGLKLEVCVQAGDFTKRNRLSLLPHELVHRQPLFIPADIIYEYKKKRSKQNDNIKYLAMFERNFASNRIANEGGDQEESEIEMREIPKPQSPQNQEKKKRKKLLQLADEEMHHFEGTSIVVPGIVIPGICGPKVVNTPAKSIFDHLYELHVEQFEADYLLVVNQEKLSFIKEQLEQDLNIQKFDPNKHLVAPERKKKKKEAEVDSCEEEGDGKVLIANQSIYFQYKKVRSEMDWMTVRHIPAKDIKQWKELIKTDRFLGGEGYGNPDDSNKCWAKRFHKLSYSKVCVKSMDKTYEEIYEKSQQLQGRLVNDELLNNFDQLEMKGGAEVMIIDKKVTKRGCCGTAVESHCGKIYLAIKMSPDQIDLTAHQYKVWGDLIEAKIRFKFNRHMQDCFQSFDARQYYECLGAHVSEQMDLAYYVESTGAIIAYYPLHKIKNSNEIRRSIMKYKWKICWNTLFGKKDVKNMEPIHFLRRYYGEKFAFQYLFFNHYMAYLTVPAVGGIVLLVVQIFMLTQMESRNFKNTVLDSELNGIFGIGLAIWSSMFVESWRKRENFLIFEWDLGIIKDKYSGQMRQKFKFMNKYDSDTNTKMKIALGDPFIYRMLNYLFLVFMAVVITYTINVIDEPDIEADFSSEAIAANISQDIYSYKGFVISLIISIYEYIFDIVCTHCLEGQNFKYQNEFDENKTIQMFMFNFYNTYFPFFYVGVINKLPEGANIVTLFSMLTSTILLDNIIPNIKRWATYHVIYKRKMNKKEKKVAEEEKDIARVTIKQKVINQIKLNKTMKEQESNVTDEYMEIVMQFGLIALFSNVFPQGALLCLFANTWKLWAINTEFKFTRRSEPELAFGIEGFMYILDVLSFLAVIVNIMISYRTSTIYEKQFKEILFVDDQEGAGQYLLEFFVVLEHFMLFLKGFIRYTMQDWYKEENDQKDRDNGIYRRDMEQKEDKRLEAFKMVQAQLANDLYRNKTPQQLEEEKRLRLLRRKGKKKARIPHVDKLAWQEFSSNVPGFAASHQSKLGWTIFPDKDIDLNEMQNYQINAMKDQLVRQLASNVDTLKVPPHKRKPGGKKD